ncbi:MAG: hypothetical protein GEV12_08505 [Micromonosporaceae bacterium]|nr:hypothetical protein [Micromonosporaceae bacterium]
MRTAITQADTHFALLVCQPAPLAFDGRGIDGLPDRMLPLDELRNILVAGVPRPVQDAVWQRLAVAARSWGPAWVVGAVGVAVPGLTRMAARLSRGLPGLAEDIDSEILAGFLHALRTEDLERPRLWLRLCWAAWRAGYAARRVEDTVELPADLHTGAGAPHRPYGHPDLLLGRAVAAGVITAAQADLIGSTRLGDVLVEQIAAEHGVAASVIRMRRKRAERTLVKALTRGELSAARPATRPASRVGR